jgi:hypothetical protein
MLRSSALAAPSFSTGLPAENDPSRCYTANGRYPCPWKGAWGFSPIPPKRYTPGIMRWVLAEVGRILTCSKRPYILDISASYCIRASMPELTITRLVRSTILLANLLQSSRSTFSWGSFLSFFAFKEGMLGTPISVLGGWPTVSVL